ncbi:MAG: hypothetical protein AB7O57_02915 [Hyphomicrobiaceae bacterium]
MTIPAIDDWTAPPEPEDLVRALDRRILEATRSPSPAMRLAFDGALGVHDIARIHDALHGIEVVAPHPRAPIDFMRTNAKEPLAHWEEVTAERFRLDFDLAMSQSAGVLAYDRLGHHDTDLTRKHRSAGYSGRGVSRSTSRGGGGEARLAAMQRRGAFAGQHHMSFWLLEAIVGFELFPKDVAPHLGWDARRVGWRFRDALADAAGFYRVHAKGLNSLPIKVATSLPGPKGGRGAASAA